MKQVWFNIFFYLSILTICDSQRLLYLCDFDPDLSSNCRFQWTPGAPTLETLYGITSTTVPKQPLSDVKSILSLTVPKNEFCVFPYSNPPETWPMYFCQRNSETNYTCPTRSGTGNCIIGKYALVQTPRAGSFDHMYTTIDTIQNHIDNFQCLDFYYYVPDTSFSAQISVGWSAGAAPFFLTDVKAKLENKWQHHQFTYENPRQTAYNVSILTILISI
ncbi:unnamed protein product [Rotaria sp. Silwood1]|nr:unnamed protein product [Rotaria sp. Silwood1]